MDHGHRGDDNRYSARVWCEVQNNSGRRTSPVCGQVRLGLSIAAQVRLEEVGRRPDDRRCRSWVLTTGRVVGPADEGEEPFGTMCLVVNEGSTPVRDQLVSCAVDQEHG